MYNQEIYKYVFYVNFIVSISLISVILYFYNTGKKKQKIYISLTTILEK